jgi:hypothetical protein
VALNEGSDPYGDAIVGAYQRDVKAQLMSSRFSRIGVDVVFVLNSCMKSFILSFTIHKINISKKTSKLRVVNSEQEKVRHLPRLPNVMLFLFPACGKITDFIAGNHIFAGECHLPVSYSYSNAISNPNAYPNSYAYSNPNSYAYSNPNS